MLAIILLLAVATLQPAHAEDAALLQKAQAGDSASQRTLGENYVNGADGFAQDNNQAAQWLQKAADQGDAEAESQVGWFYENGMGGMAKGRYEGDCLVSERLPTKGQSVGSMQGRRLFRCRARRSPS